jgi:predicted TIM-barrel fold metal-dependent hydrolase
MFLHPEYPSYEDQIKARDNLLRKNPGLNFVGCHLGSLEWNVDSIADRLDRFPNLVVDMSARICHLQYQSAHDRDKVRNFCIKYQDRLLYGTDTGYSGKDPDEFRMEMHNTWLADWKYFTSDEDMNAPQFRGNFRGLKLPREIIDKIYFTNAVRWYKLQVE